MGVKIFIAVFIVISLLGLVKAQYGSCDYEGTITATNSSLYINQYPSTGNCRYKIYSPLDTFMTVSCTATLLGNCTNQNITISRSGEIDLRDGLADCISSTFVRQSVGNEVVVAFRSLTPNSGSFQCRVTAVAPTNANCDCSWNVNSKIVGGTQSGVNEFTSHAALVDLGNRAEPYCGGVVIQQKYVLTAAHCLVSPYAPSNTAILVGDHNLDTGTDTKWQAAYTISKFIIHSSYKPDTNLNDIGLVQTTKYIRYTLGVSPGCLPYTFNGVDFTGNSLVAVGWGTTSFAGIPSRILLKVSLPVVTNTYCASKMNYVDASKICTYAAGKDTCGRDSGGGLYWYANRYYPIGIVSYGNGCAGNTPSVNTRITSYFGWIESTAGGFFCRKT